MTASSQNPSGAQAPEFPSTQRPLREPVPLRAAVGTVTTAATQAPLLVQDAAAAVISAEMRDGHSNAQQLAKAEQTAGLLFDAERAQAAVDAARAQGRAELAAEMAQLREDSEALAWFRARWQAIGRLCEGRPLDHMVEVGEVLAAADGKTPTAAPLTLSWDRCAAFPQADAADQRAIVECTTARGGRADLVLTGEERLALASLLDAEFRDIHTPCATGGCGTDRDLDASDPGLSGWTRVQVAGTGEGARWYCTPMCVSAALARAGAQLAEIDDRAALDGGL